MHVNQFDISSLDPSLLQKAKALETRLDKTGSTAENEWTFRFTGSIHEAFLRFDGKKNYEGKCNCDFFNEENICSHIIACYLFLEKRVKVLPEVRISSILEQANPLELISFIRYYSRKDKKFATLLKARFVRHLETDNPCDKYRAVIKSAKKLAVNKSGEYGQAGLKTLNTILNELVQAGNDLVGLQDYVELFWLTNGVLTEILPVWQHARKKSLETNLKIDPFFKYFSSMLLHGIGPAIRDEMWVLCTSIFQKYELGDSSSAKIFYETLYQLADEKVKYTFLLESLKDRFTDKGTDSGTAFLYIKLLEKQGQKGILNTEPELLFTLVKAAMVHQLYQFAIIAGERLLKEGHHENVVTEFLLRIAMNDRDKKRISKFAEKRFIQTEDLDYYKLIDNGYRKGSVSLAKIIKSFKTDQRKRYLYSGILDWDGKYDLLIEFITNKRDIDLLNTYLPTLFKQRKSFVKGLTRNIIENYLENHVGRHAALKTRGLISELIGIGEEKFARELLEDIRVDHKERNSLIEELSIFD